MKVQIDFREKDRVNSATKYFKKQGLETEVCELEVGDYLFNDQVCFEYKTIPDFVASIQDGRVFNQSVQMSETYDYNFVIIQGDEHNRAKSLAMSRNYRRITVFQYLGAISSLNRYVTVIEAYNPFIEESYYRMLTQAKKCLSERPIVKKFPRKDKNPAFNYLCYCVYGLNSKRATTIVETLNLHTLNDLTHLTVKDLTKIDGIGEKTAKNIIKSIL